MDGGVLATIITFRNVYVFLLISWEIHLLHFNAMCLKDFVLEDSIFLVHLKMLVA